jgi:hypothetical protein
MPDRDCILKTVGAAYDGSNQRATEVEGKPKQKAADYVAQITRLSEAPGEEQ